MAKTHLHTEKEIMKERIFWNTRKENNNGREHVWIYTIGYPFTLGFINHISPWKPSPSALVGKMKAFQ